MSMLSPNQFNNVYIALFTPDFFADGSMDKLQMVGFGSVETAQRFGLIILCLGVRQGRRW
jgi:hypothetical protein